MKEQTQHENKVVCDEEWEGGDAIASEDFDTGEVERC